MCAPRPSERERVGFFSVRDGGCKMVEQVAEEHLWKNKRYGLRAAG